MSDKPMSGAARKRHLRTAGQRVCPYCRADVDEHVDYEEFSPVEGGDVEQTAECRKCRRRWIDVFRLVEVREIVSRE